MEHPRALNIGLKNVSWRVMWPVILIGLLNLTCHVTLEKFFLHQYEVPQISHYSSDYSCTKTPSLFYIYPYIITPPPPLLTSYPHTSPNAMTHKTHMKVFLPSMFYYSLPVLLPFMSLEILIISYYYIYILSS